MEEYGIGQKSLFFQDQFQQKHNQQLLQEYYQLFFEDFQNNLLMLEYPQP